MVVGFRVQGLGFAGAAVVVGFRFHGLGFACAAVIVDVGQVGGVTARVVPFGFAYTYSIRCGMHTASGLHRDCIRFRCISPTMRCMKIFSMTKLFPIKYRDQ